MFTDEPMWVSWGSASGPQGGHDPRPARPPPCDGPSPTPAAAAAARGATFAQPQQPDLAVEAGDPVARQQQALGPEDGAPWSGSRAAGAGASGCRRCRVVGAGPVGGLGLLVGSPRPPRSSTSGRPPAGRGVGGVERPASAASQPRSASARCRALQRLADEALVVVRGSRCPWPGTGPGRRARSRRAPGTGAPPPTTGPSPARTAPWPTTRPAGGRGHRVTVAAGAGGPAGTGGLLTCRRDLVGGNLDRCHGCSPS